MPARLIYPCEQYIDSYLSFSREFIGHDVKTSRLKDPDRYGEWGPTFIQDCADHREGRNLPKGFVPSTAFWLIEDDEIVGIGNVRHRLNEFLERRGGHIGYAIRYGKWGKGYGTLQLRLLLGEARKLGIQRALITCDDDNIASARVMEKNGGVHQDTILVDLDGTQVRTRRYWVDTAQ